MDRVGGDAHLGHHWCAELQPGVQDDCFALAQRKPPSRSVATVLNAGIQRRLDDVGKDELLAQHVDQAWLAGRLLNRVEEDTLAVGQELLAGQRIVCAEILCRCVHRRPDHFEVDAVAHERCHHAQFEQVSKTDHLARQVLACELRAPKRLGAYFLPLVLPSVALQPAAHRTWLHTHQARSLLQWINAGSDEVHVAFPWGSNEWMSSVSCEAKSRRPSSPRPLAASSADAGCCRAASPRPERSPGPGRRCTVPCSGRAASLQVDPHQARATAAVPRRIGRF